MVKHCQNCGAMIENAKYNQMWCSECKPSMKAKYNQQYDSQRYQLRKAGCNAAVHKDQTKKLTYTILKDPIPLTEGGFRPGVALGVHEVREMIKMNSFQNGTILKDGKNKYIVRNGKLILK